jgi:hypothetical protein
LVNPSNFSKKVSYLHKQRLTFHRDKRNATAKESIAHLAARSIMVGTHSLAAGSTKAGISSLAAGSIREGSFRRLAAHPGFGARSLAGSIAAGIIIASGVEATAGHLGGNSIWEGEPALGVVEDIAVGDVGWDGVAGMAEEEYRLVLALAGEFVELHLGFEGGDDLAEGSSIGDDIVRIDDGLARSDVADGGEYGLQECDEHRLEAYSDVSVGLDLPGLL